MAQEMTVKVHPLPVRIAHWLNVLAVLMMIAAILRIVDIRKEL